MEVMPLDDTTSAGSVIYIDRSDVHADRWDELKAAIPALTAFVEREQPQMTTYAFYLDECADHMTVISVHPDSSSLERHMEIGRPEFQKLAPFLSLREIEVFGPLSQRAVDLVSRKAEALGDSGAVLVHDEFTGFTRIQSGSNP
jgi:hypothetical protein